MREILYRGKSNFGNIGEWLYSMTISQHCYNDNEIFSYYFGHGFKTVDAKTLGQYTGFNDKNGTKIFEGDIIKLDGQYIRYIEYSGECAAFIMMRYVDRLTSEYSGYLGKGYDNYKHTVEVIGNVHDNPELLIGVE